MRLDFRERLDYHVLIVVIDKWVKKALEEVK